MSDANAESKIGITTKADATMFRGIRIDDPKNVRITSKTGGLEVEHVIARPGTSHKPLIELLATLLKDANEAADSIQAYRGDTPLD